MSAKIRITTGCPRCGQTMYTFFTKQQLKNMLTAVNLQNERVRQKAIKRIVDDLDIRKGVPD